MLKKKPPKTKLQGPWKIKEYDGYIEFSHRETRQRFLKENDWLHGLNAYEYSGYETPLLTDIFVLVRKLTPGTTGFIYRDWHVKRDINCFVYILVKIENGRPVTKFKNIVGDFTSKQEDFAAFLAKLDRIEADLEIVEHVDLGGLLVKNRKEIGHGL